MVAVIVFLHLAIICQGKKDLLGWLAKKVIPKPEQEVIQKLPNVLLVASAAFNSLLVFASFLFWFYYGDEYFMGQLYIRNRLYFFSRQPL